MFINYNDYISISNIIDKWDLHRIPGDQITLVKTIASGGQGKVKLGKYNNINVIVKIPHILTISTFTTELLNTYKYRHPNIPKFIGVYESSTNFGIVIEHIDGITMTKLIALEKQNKIHLSLIQKLDFMIQLVSIVDFLHSHSLMHRDLKTDNILIDHLGSLKLIDFGIALRGTEKLINMNSPEYSLTPKYMAPEILLQTQEDDDDEEGEFEEEEDDNSHYNKLSETYNKVTLHSSFALEKIRTKFRELTKNEEFKLSSWNNGKWILITNKYDIWTLGIIMAQIFTRCKPWCRNEKENISEMEAQTRLFSQLPYPIFTLHPYEECVKYEEELKMIMRRCLVYDQDERAGIEEIKQRLMGIFYFEVRNKENIERMILLKNMNRENKKINDVLKEIKEEKKRDFIRFNKLLVRKEIDVNKIKELNNINKKDDRAIELLIQRINKKREGNIYQIGNTMLDNFIKANLYKSQRLAINMHKIHEYKQKMEEKSNSNHF